MVAHETLAAVAIKHIAWWSRHADPEGAFARMTRKLPDLSDLSRVTALLGLGYDGFLYLNDDVIVGHFFYQRHKDEMHAFAAWTDTRHRASGMMAVAAMDFVAYAWAAQDVARVRIGAGANLLAKRLLAPMDPVARRFGWRIREGNWVEF
jgi:hypothetical protein